MSIFKKNLRKITINNQIFYWGVRNEEDDCDMPHLIVQSNDKSFSIRYKLSQQNKALPSCPVNPHIIVIGKTFKGLDHLGHGWERFLTPHWDEGESITPSFVATVINWCFTVEGVTTVNYKGEILPSRRTHQHYFERRV